jgi:hypothetical protein
MVFGEGLKTRAEMRLLILGTSRSVSCGKASTFCSTIGVPHRTLYVICMLPVGIAPGVLSYYPPDRAASCCVVS